MEKVLKRNLVLSVETYEGVRVGVCHGLVITKHRMIDQSFAVTRVSDEVCISEAWGIETIPICSRAFFSFGAANRPQAASTTYDN